MTLAEPVKTSESEAVALFEAFHGRAPRAEEIALIGMRAQEWVLRVGEIHGIQYKIPSEAQTYFHKFGPSNRPLLFCTSDGTQIYILKGGYRFTDRGFIR